MAKIRTHYDNLNVARTADIAVIKAAYKALAQKYHPDRNPDNPNAEWIMQIINKAYEVLSDPIKRAEHDRWIDEQERRAGQSHQSTNAYKIQPIVHHLLVTPMSMPVKTRIIKQMATKGIMSMLMAIKTSTAIKIMISTIQIINKNIIIKMIIERQ